MHRMVLGEAEQPRQSQYYIEIASLVLAMTGKCTQIKEYRSSPS
jgi:hypothetical protein